MNREFIALCLKAIKTGESQLVTFDTKSDATSTRIQFYKFRKTLHLNSLLYQISIPNAINNTLLINLITKNLTTPVEDEYLAEADTLLEDESSKVDTVLQGDSKLGNILDLLERGEG